MTACDTSRKSFRTIDAISLPGAAEDQEEEEDWQRKIFEGEACGQNTL
jgi:hypothetical protein